ncbi:hypothetical protein VOLCADRAFT_94341 [Volvox carteri f. nagariensis]|uniref:Uncharacterized protein n=1 Tax=Volvox carteri f. nagariensis TaxID=3068 RepID=D8U487_VOLCA|nr:uncharacterized protein VOLCADRAFT_94341 [Volvox carteri f. nagariensis]EFJ45459.1 hypothetical protein VOLCADRAFT_94341 [Volvox carteri f. nagariensis]|eukprot:XP_002953486.1 hypothetical protein VOLCADRAFT_94341 [Volvox carteri f. nagariensis]
MASVKLAKLPPLERLGIVAGALNAAVGCIAPRRVVKEDRRQQQQQLMLLPSLAKMQLLPPDDDGVVVDQSPPVVEKEAEEAAQQQRQDEKAETVDSTYVVVRVDTCGELLGVRVGRALEFRVLERDVVSV